MTVFYIVEVDEKMHSRHSRAILMLAYILIEYLLTSNQVCFKGRCISVALAHP